MATFAYRARDNTGRIVSGTLEADSDRTAVATLRDRGFMVTSLERQEKEAGPSQPISFFGGKINRQDVVLFTRQLATMVAAGLPLVTSLEVLSQQTSSRRLKEVIQSVRRGIEAGGTLSGEMAKHPKVFSELYVNTVRSGEVSGALDSIAEYLASYMEAEMDLAARIKTAATYPGVVIGASMTVGVVAIKFVLPTFVSLLTSLKAELPLPTRIMVTVSFTVEKFWLPMILGALASIAGLVTLARVERGRWIIDNIMLRTPIIGPLVQKVALARFARTFAVIIKSGMPLLQGLEVVAKAVGNRVIARDINEAAAGVREGRALHEMFSKSKVIPLMISHMIRVGEETGAMEEVLNKAAQFYEQQVDYILRRLTSILEPVMIIGVGGMVAFIAFSILLPVFSLISAIK